MLTKFERSHVFRSKLPRKKLEKSNSSKEITNLTPHKWLSENCLAILLPNTDISFDSDLKNVHYKPKNILYIPPNADESNANESKEIGLHRQVPNSKNKILDSKPPDSSNSNVKVFEQKRNNFEFKTKHFDSKTKILNPKTMNIEFDRKEIFHQNTNTNLKNKAFDIHKLKINSKTPSPDNESTLRNFKTDSLSLNDTSVSHSQSLVSKHHNSNPTNNFESNLVEHQTLKLGVDIKLKTETKNNIIDSDLNSKDSIMVSINDSHTQPESLKSNDSKVKAQEHQNYKFKCKIPAPNFKVASLTEKQVSPLNNVAKKKYTGNKEELSAQLAPWKPAGCASLRNLRRYSSFKQTLDTSERAKQDLYFIKVS